MKTCIVVSGGDAPGINAAIECYLRLAGRQGDQVVGAQDGFPGLLAGRVGEIDRAAVALLAGRGGAWLRSSREPALATTGARGKLRGVMKDHQIDNLLLFGGDGTIRTIMPLLDGWGAPCIALPTTIDNDVVGSDYSLGHDSACNYACQTINGIKATAHALPGRIFMVETLGGDCGNLALAIAYASGADAALLPEYDFQMDWLADRLKTAGAEKGAALAVLCEGVKNIQRIVAEIPKLTGTRVRHSKLGHAQRGADVSHVDRVVARDMCRLAFDAFKSGVSTATVISVQGSLRLHRGTLPEGRAVRPDYDRYAFVNRL